MLSSATIRDNIYNRFIGIIPLGIDDDEPIDLDFILEEMSPCLFTRKELLWNDSEYTMLSPWNKYDGKYTWAYAGSILLDFAVGREYPNAPGRMCKLSLINLENYIPYNIMTIIESQEELYRAMAWVTTMPIRNVGSRDPTVIEEPIFIMDLTTPYNSSIYPDIRSYINLTSDGIHLLSDEEIVEILSKLCKADGGVADDKFYITLKNLHRGIWNRSY